MNETRASSSLAYARWEYNSIQYTKTNEESGQAALDKHENPEPIMVASASLVNQAD
jgi:hypothetical protein